MHIATPAAKPHSIHPRTAIDAIRQNTCYSGLRFVINVATCLVVALIIAAGVALAYAIVQPAANNPAPAPALVAGDAVVCVVLVFAMLLIRDALRIGIDIADTLIASHSRGPR